MRARWAARRAGCSHLAEGQSDHPPQGRALRGVSDRVGVAQASLAVPGVGVPEGLVHRVVAGGPARARLTTRLRSACGAGAAEGFSSVLAAADHYGLSWPVAHQAFIAHVEPVLAEPIPPVRVLGIDETRRGKPQWGQDQVSGRWRIVHDRWHTAVVDTQGTAGLLAHIDGRTAACVTDWLEAQPDWWREGVTRMSIDLSASYLLAVTNALPHAVVVADRFHLVALANTMLTEVRQNATRTARGPVAANGTRSGPGVASC